MQMMIISVHPEVLCVAKLLAFNAEEKAREKEKEAQCRTSPKQSEPRKQTPSKQEEPKK